MRSIGAVLACATLAASASMACSSSGTGGSGGGGGIGGSAGSGGTGGTAGTGGSGGTGGSAVVNATITIVPSMKFTPDNVNVSPGGTITVNNTDGNTPHSVTSETSVGDFRAGAVNGISFDTGTFSAGTRMINIPASAQVGTVIHYFCTVHKGFMSAPKEPTVTIVQ